MGKISKKTNRHAARAQQRSTAPPRRPRKSGLATALALADAFGSLDTELTKGQERSMFSQCEKLIEDELAGDIALGIALGIVHKARLYKRRNQSFEAYCEQDWGVSRSYAYELIAAAEVVRNVRDSGHFTRLPANPAQARALARLDPQRQVEAWAKIEKQIGSGRITARFVDEFIYEFEGTQIAAQPDEPDEAGTAGDKLDLRLDPDDGATGNGGNAASSGAGRTLADTPPDDSVMPSVAMQAGAGDDQHGDAVEQLLSVFIAGPQPGPTHEGVPADRAIDAWVMLSDVPDEQQQRREQLAEIDRHVVVERGREIVLATFWAAVRLGVLGPVEQGDNVAYRLTAAGAAAAASAGVAR